MRVRRQGLRSGVLRDDAPDLAEGPPDPFAGGGRMGAAMAAFDWAGTALGPVQDWPAGLRATVNLCLSSRAPMMVVWGPEHVQLYNDALAPLMGPKHPAALGRPYAESFPEIWHERMEPLLAALEQRGEASYQEDVPVSFHRNVPDEEMFWTFSWSPLRDETGKVVGALHPAVETTGRVVAERRMALLRDLATSVGQAAGVQQACERAVAVLADHPADTPLAAVYLLEDHVGAGVPLTARLASCGGVQSGDAVFPAEVDLTEATYSTWPLRAAAATPGAVTVVCGLELDPAWLLPPAAARPPATGAVVALTRPGSRQPLGLLALGLSPSRPYDQVQADFLQLLAGQLSAALATAALHEQQRDVAVALQRSLLPDTSRGSSTLETAARYLPSTAGTAVGGDWYDVVPLGAGRTALIIGDVMGHGIPAATVMGQLRAAVRAYAQLDLPPEQVLELLDQLVEHISEAQDIGQIVTCIYAVHDPGDATLTLASAGHPPPLLAQGEDWQVWEGPVGPPLGTAAGGYAASSRPLPTGARLLLYTDGLVEQRDRDLDEGIDLLRHTVGGPGHDDLERLADAALSVRGTDRRDDVALLALRVPFADLPAPVLVDLSADNRAARTARRRTAAALASWGVPAGVLDDVALLAGELVNNAVTHTGRPRSLRVRRLADRVVLEVADSDARAPRRVESSPAAEGGRGLMILDALASDWGVRHLGAGKVVWVEVALPRHGAGAPGTAARTRP